MLVHLVTKKEEHQSAVYDNVLHKLDELGVGVVGDIAACDAVVTIGGDGTILRAGRGAAMARKPLLGINTGTLGFMATLETDELDKLARLKTADYSISRRMALSVECLQESHLALNDVVLHRAATARLPEFTVLRGDTEVLKIRADGMIAASPTGSTAYSLSAGGPMIEPELECFLLTAVCPHTLFNRPMIFSPESRLRICTNNVSVIVDGNMVAEYTENSTVTVTKSAHYLDLIDIDGNSFYNSIHNKLMKPLK
ncbi:MAG: NAD(+)/NADH kinase [Oscillospiraceae bacterium]|nr:NAD(+)/NADH kinase [Oscillospiraceae bacterium]